MNTKEVCKNFGVTPKALRVYEEQKLISPVRHENNYRSYSIDDVIKIQIIKALRDLGFSLQEIRSALEYNKSKHDHLNSFYIQTKAIESKITELNSAKARINDAINALLQSDGKEMDIREVISNANVKDEKTVFKRMVDRWNFDLMAVDYVNRYLKEDTPYFNAIRTTQSLIQKCPPGTRTLDVGGGTCNLWLGLEPVTNLTVLDKSLPMILSAKENAPWARFVLDDILEVDFDKYGCFDLVLTTFTLHHIPHDKQHVAIKNMLHFVCPNGYLLVVDRSFRDEAELRARERALIEGENQEALDIFRSEFYPIVEDMVRFVRGLGHHIDAFPVDEYIWGYRIY